MITEFADNLQEDAHSLFQNWRLENPNGFFITPKRKDSYLLHHVGCHHIGSPFWDGTVEESRGSQHSITSSKKTCSTNPNELLKWLADRKHSHTTCNHCIDSSEPNHLKPSNSAQNRMDGWIDANQDEFENPRHIFITGDKHAPIKNLRDLDEFEFNIDIDLIPQDKLRAVVLQLGMKPKAKASTDDLLTHLVDCDDDCVLRDALFAVGVTDAHPCFSFATPQKTDTGKQTAAIDIRTSPDVVEDTAQYFYNDVFRSMQDSQSSRQARLAIAKKIPDRIPSASTAFRRNPDVVAEVLLRAKGKCEGCLQPAPFTRTSDGTPYLEVHHRIMLATGGEDTVDNAIALCPNCHRAAHYA